jgi:hypothetical protein
MKNIKTQSILGIAILTMVIFLSLTTNTDAAGYSIYGPYGPHNPVDTSIVGTDAFSVIGLGLYGVGSALILSTSKLKKLILK